MEDVEGTKVHDNKMEVIGYNLQHVRYIRDSFLISEGQPYDAANPVTCDFASNVKGFMTWEVTIPCGRHKTLPPASLFYQRCGGEDHMFGMGAFTGKYPQELNFTFGVEVELEVDGKTATVPLYVGQGSAIGITNWWAGTPRLTRVEGTSYYQITPDFDGRRALFHVMNPNGNRVQFAFQRWL